VNFQYVKKSQFALQQITKGDFDVNDLVGFAATVLLLQSRHEPCFEIFSFVKEKHLETNHQCKYSYLRLIGVKRYVTTLTAKNVSMGNFTLKF
jgi:hypothetical protein